MTVYQSSFDDSSRIHHDNQYRQSLGFSSLEALRKSLASLIYKQRNGLRIATINGLKRVQDASFAFRSLILAHIQTLRELDMRKGIHEPLSKQRGAIKQLLLSPQALEALP